MTPAEQNTLAVIGAAAAYTSAVALLDQRTGELGRAVGALDKTTEDEHEIELRRRLIAAQPALENLRRALMEVHSAISNPNGGSWSHAEQNGREPERN